METATAVGLDELRSRSAWVATITGSPHDGGTIGTMNSNK